MKEVIAEKISEIKGILDLKINNVYVAIFKQGYLWLNQNIKLKASNLVEGKRYAVKITKIKFPGEIEGVVVGDNFKELDKEGKNIADFSAEDNGKFFYLNALIEDVQIKNGIQIIYLNDGTGTIKAVYFSNEKIKLKKGDFVRAKIMINARDTSIEAHLDSYILMDEKHKQQFENKMETRIQLKSDVEKTNFLVDDANLEKLKPMIIKAAREIRKAIFELRPIILRHHATDVDGYTSGIALEKAILPMVKQQIKDQRLLNTYYKRVPTLTPFYDVPDSLRDLDFFFEHKKKHLVKPPLLIITDLGSHNPSSLAFDLLKSYNFKIVVIDHHPTYGEERAQFDVFANSTLVNVDMTAGMLSTEIARLVNNTVKDINFLPALSGIGDKASGSLFEKYLEIAKENYTLDFLKKLAKVVDYYGYYLRNMDIPGFVDDLFGADLEKQKFIVEHTYNELQKMFHEKIKLIEKNVVLEKLKDFCFARFDVSKVLSEHDYPTPGKLAGLYLDYLNGNCVIVAYSSSSMTFRANKGVHFNFNKLIEDIKLRFPDASIYGGGHSCAGSFNFLSAFRDDILDFVVAWIRKL